jgi:hypothetical protein
MCIDTREYQKGTSISSRAPWGVFVGCRALCPDGRVRAVKLALTADTFWTIPAKLSYRGKTVCGFVTFASDSGLSTDPEQYLQFVPTGKHRDIFKS